MRGFQRAGEEASGLAGKREKLAGQLTLLDASNLRGGHAEIERLGGENVEGRRVGLRYCSCPMYGLTVVHLFVGASRSSVPGTS